MTDLTRALRDLQESGAGAAGAAPVEAVLARRRRRRAVRRSALGVTSAAAATGLVLGGMTLLGDGAVDPVPPAHDPDLVEATWLGTELAACGEPLGTDEPAGSWLVSADVPNRLGQVGLGGLPVDVGAVLASGEEEYVAVGGSHRGSALLLVRDGVVVALGTTGTEPGSTDGPESAVEATPDDPADLGFTTTVEPCGEEPLAPGTYDAWTALELRWEWGRYADGREAVADSAYGWVGVAGTVVVDGAPSAPAVALPACGAPTDGLAATTGTLVGTTSLQVGVTDTGTGEFLPEGYGDVVQAALGLVNDSPGTLAVQRGEVRAVLARDGVVVAEAELGRGDGTAEELAAGGLVRRSGSVPVESCTDGEYLGAGEYTLWATSDVTVDGAVGTTVVHEPVPFTVFEFEDAADPGPGTWTADGFVPSDADTTDAPDDDAADGAADDGADDLVLGFDGIDGLPLGTVLTGTTSPSPHVVWDPVQCEGTESPGSWRAAYPDVEGLNGMPTPPFDVLVMEERLRAIVVKGPGPRTTEGLGLGSTLAEVQAAYDVRPGEDDGLDVEGWVVQEDGSTLLFEIARDYPDGTPSWSAEQKGTVVGMAVMADGYRVQPRGWEWCG